MKHTKSARELRTSDYRSCYAAFSCGRLSKSGRTVAQDMSKQEFLQLAIQLLQDKAQEAGLLDARLSFGRCLH